MRAIRRADTKPEVRVRSALHRLGYRFRKDLRLRAGDTWVRPDIVFTGRKMAVFIDGCFWHCCPTHGRQPGKNQVYWAPKLVRNVERDRVQTQSLLDAGWRVVRIWEHETVDQAVAKVEMEYRLVGDPHA